MTGLVTDEAIEFAAQIAWDTVGPGLNRHSWYSWEILQQHPEYRAQIDHTIKVVRTVLETSAPMIAAAALRQSMGWLRGYVGAVWDDGNAVGLDGWIGPGRGSDEVDTYAIRARERAIDRLQGHVDASADELEAGRIHTDALAERGVQALVFPITVLWQDSGTRACRSCACTDDVACPGGCTWDEYDLCSACAANDSVEWS